MKTKLILLTASLLTTFSLSAHGNAPFWVIEGNVARQDTTIVRFYDAESNLIHITHVTARKLDIQKRRDRKLLNKKLKEVTAQEAMASGKR